MINFEVAYGLSLRLRALGVNTFWAIATVQATPSGKAVVGVTEMRIIKALLVLVFLLPTLAAAQSTPESSFVRIQRDGNREPAALQTAIVTYVPTDSAKGVEVDLVSVIHIGERDYYQLLNTLFE